VFDFVLLLLAAICFIVAALGLVPPPTSVLARINFVAAGLFFWVLISVIKAFPKG
jgi:hypothetical protein